MRRLWPPVVPARCRVHAVPVARLEWHAGRTPHAVIQLGIFRKPTFTASVIGGGFMRVAMGANPFLLAMLLQVAFGMSAFAAGLMTFISAVGALVMKTTAPPILRRFGFRTVLLPRANQPKQSIDDVKLIAVKRVEDALDAIRE